MNDFKKIRIESGMSRTEFAEHFEIPYRTVQNWELGLRECPDYLLKLIEFKLNQEDLIRKDMNKSKEDSIVYVRKSKEEMKKILEKMGQNPPRGYKFNENGDLIVDNGEAEKIKDEIRRFLGETKQSAIIDKETFAEIKEKLKDEKK